MWIIAQTTAELNVWRCNLPVKPKRGVSLVTCVAIRTRDANRATELLSSCEFKVPQMFAGGEPAIPSPARSVGNPLGETARWVMKAPLQRDYIGIQEMRVVQEKVKESCQDRLRLIHLVPVRLARKATIAAND